jgi:crotonobetainyl-CoA:carnitine CoA-transferase CaiB-like acyl-CoA transferase
VRVLDLSRLLPGAFATLMLAELGADIIKVEDPSGGDPIRQLPPFINPQGVFAAPGRSVYDLLLNRGKRSIVLNLRDSSSQSVLDALLSSADVVVESFRPATAQRLGVSGAQLRARHPRLIHLALTGYGQTGPYAERPGHDLNYVAVYGVRAADRPEPAHLPRMFIADVGGGAMSAVIAVLAALFGRERSGAGATLDLSMHDAALYWVMLPGARDLIDGGDRAAGELPTFGDHACYNVYETRDGRQVALGALEAKFWTTFCDAIGRSDLGARQLTSPADQAAVLREVRVRFRTRTQAEWLAFFEGRDVCLSPVNTPGEAFSDPHIAARGTVIHAPGLRAVRAPFGVPGTPLRPAPNVGQDTDDILQSLT